MLKYLVIGAGAIGSVFGGFLSKLGRDVTLVGRDPHMSRIRENGLHISGIWGEHVVRVDKLFTDTRSLGEEQYDVILLCVKSYDTEQAVREAVHHLKPDSIVVSLQNGIGNIEIIAELVGWERTVGGRVIFGVELASPGAVKITVYAEEVMLGSPNQQVERNKIQNVCDDFNKAKIPTALTEEIEKLIWAKLLYSCALNPLATIFRKNYGFLIEQEETRSIMRQVVKEIFDVAHAREIGLSWKRPQEYIDLLFSKLIPATYDHRPSMLQDIINGKRTEIDGLNGAVCSLAHKLGVAVPFNQAIRDIVKTFESLALGSK